MGLFGGYKCSFCGSDRGFFSNTSLKNGNVCNDCKSKFSAFFSVDATTTVEEVKQHLEYRTENKNTLGRFNFDRTIRLKNSSIYIDFTKKQIFINGNDKGINGNPDVFPFSGIKEISSKIDNKKSEKLKKSEDGKHISYDPPIYETKYSFDIIIILANSAVSGQYTIRLEDDVDSTDYFELELKKSELDKIVHTLNELNDFVHSDISISRERRRLYCQYCGSKLPNADGICDKCGI